MSGEGAGVAVAQAILSLQGVDFAYPNSGLRMKGLDFSVSRGEMVALVGPNGSGKTTLLRLASGLLTAQGGTVRVCGCDPARTRRRELARRVAMVGQQPALGFPFTVHEVVLMGRAPHVEGFRLESSRDLKAAARAMRATGIEQLAGRSFDSLSSGEQQRVSLARALAQDPELVLLDEPAAFLDIKQQTRTYELLRQSNRDSGLTVVSVLHDLNLAALYFDRVAMLCHGAIHAAGAPERVLSYRNIREVFETDVYVDVNSLTGTMIVLPLPRSRNAKVKAT